MLRVPPPPDAGPLLREERTSTIRRWMTAFDPHRTCEGARRDCRGIFILGGPFGVSLIARFPNGF
jgi:hypothetical protein